MTTLRGSIRGGGSDTLTRMRLGSGWTALLFTTLLFATSIAALACGGTPKDLCGELEEDRVLGRCVCPAGTTPSEDGWSCLLADGGVIVDPSAPPDASTAFPRDGGLDAAACEEGEPCTTPGGAAGRCQGGACVAPRCGNGVLDEGERCDDGRNGDDADGCRDDCSWTCEADVECDDGNVCNGAERCVLASHTCANGSALDCDDRDNCTADTCDAELGCRNALIDGDSDGFAPARLGTCATRPGASRDCDDEDNQRYPGAPEQCDGEDNDCDELMDESTVRFDCFRDADGDGYPNPLDRVVDCACPEGFMPRRADGLTDCMDTNPGVNPGVTEFSAVSYAAGGGTTSFDWNCDGMEERLPTSGCSGSGSSCSGGDWQVGAPVCGQEGNYCVCSGLPVGSPPRLVGCEPVNCLATFAQECR